MNVTRFLRDHEDFVRVHPWTPALARYHREQLDFLHRERVVHLGVTLTFGTLFLGTVLFLQLSPSLPALLLALLLLVLLVPYLVHYYRLENTAQRWHLLLLSREGFGPYDASAADGTAGAAGDGAEPLATAAPSASPPSTAESRDPSTRVASATSSNNSSASGSS